MYYYLPLHEDIATISPTAHFKGAQCGQPKDVGCLVKPSAPFSAPFLCLMNHLVTPTDEFLVVSLDFEGLDSIERSSQEGLSSVLDIGDCDKCGYK